MKNPFYFLFSVMIISLMLIGASCDDDSPTASSDGIVKVISSSSGGNLKANDGTEIVVPAGSILDNQSGTGGTVSFSIETQVKDLPVEIPSGYTVIGGVTHFGPSHFVFVEPIRLFLNAASLDDLENIVILRFAAAENKWKAYPISEIDAENKRIGISTFELGFFAVARSQSIGKIPQIQYTQRSGGIRYDHPSMSDYYITLMVDAFTPKNQNDGGMVSIGWNTSTGNRVTGGPQTSTYMTGIPQGEYSIIVSRVRAGTLSTLPGQREYYSVPATVTVNGFTSTFSWDWRNWQGWANLSLPGGGTWTTTPPQLWPTPTQAFGTGDFQATLSWINNSSSATDLDLHLFGPNDMHVYFGNERSSDNTVELDLDWREDYGNATENIYSIGNMPRGEYSVYVNAYSDDVPKQFNVRIIRKGNIVKTYRGTATKLYTDKDKSEMILIEKFNL